MQNKLNNNKSLDKFDKFFINPKLFYIKGFKYKK